MHQEFLLPQVLQSKPGQGGWCWHSKVIETLLLIIIQPYKQGLDVTESSTWQQTDSLDRQADSHDKSGQSLHYTRTHQTQLSSSYYKNSALTARAGRLKLSRGEIIRDALVYRLQSISPGFTGTCVFRRHKTNTVSSCVKATVKPLGWLPFTEMINHPSVKAGCKACFRVCGWEFLSLRGPGS